MNEKELAAALLHWDAASARRAADPTQMAAAIIRRDARRVRLVAAVCVTIWFLAAALILAVLVVFGFLVPKDAKVQQEFAAAKITAAERDARLNELLVGYKKAGLLGAFSVAGLSFAALSTVVLVLASRRATLRQVNANLLEISRQLAELRTTPAPRSGPDGTG